jgi:hypothetical protein
LEAGEAMLRRRTTQYMNSKESKSERESVVRFMPKENSVLWESDIRRLH